MSTTIGGSIYNEPSEPPEPVDPTSFIFRQPTPAASWVINHNLNGFPAVTTTDLVGNVIVGQVQYLSANTVVVTFSVPVAGVAYLNI
jgi:hypothetical protein